MFDIYYRAEEQIAELQQNINSAPKVEEVQKYEHLLVLFRTFIARPQHSTR